MAEKKHEQERPGREHPHETRGRTTDELSGKAVITKSDGRKIGSVQDLLLDPDSMSVAGVVISKGGLMDQDISILPSGAIESWGEDAILVDNPEVIKREDELPERERWLSASDKIKGRTVVTTEGKKLGQVNDVLIDNNGQIIAYTLSEGLFGETKEIPASTTETFGEDVLIVDVNR